MRHVIVPLRALLLTGDQLKATLAALEADLEDLIAGMGRSDRSLAEAEGMGEWERRPGKRESGQPGVSSERRGPLSEDDLRARARGLRNPREWEKK